MIAILSYRGFEQGTNPIVDWLLYYKANFVKIAIEDVFNPELPVVVDINKNSILINNKDITSQVTTICYRRLFSSLSKEFDHIPFKNQIRYEVTDEINTLAETVFNIFKDCNWLPKPNMVGVNKLNILMQAIKCGLKVPKSQVINNKKQLLSFFHSCSNGIITKPIEGSGYFIDGENTYSSYTTFLDEETIKSFPDKFIPSLFQESIKRSYEVRVFYLDGKFYSVAALVSNTEAQVDIKQSFESEYIHWVPYNLPKKLEDKLDKFMRYIDLNTGSMDIIRIETGEYIFIEVNPVGQYGAPSYSGNYYLEKKIAEWLIMKDRAAIN